MPAGDGNNNQNKILRAAFNVKLIYESALNIEMCVIVFMVKYTPVRAPRDGGDKANVREKDVIFFDAIQGIVHLTEWQSVQLELELHLTQRQCQEFTKQ